MSGIKLTQVDEATIPTPETGKDTIFMDLATGQPSYKDDAGTVTSLQGIPGPGVPVGGTTGQALTKIDATDYNTQWTTQFSSPMTTAEDIIIGGVAGAPARLGKGANGTFLGVVAGALAYATPAGSGTVTSVGSGTGLTGGPITGAGSISLNSASIASLALADTAVQPAGLSSYAPLANPALTGNPTAPTATAGDTDTSIATTAFVRTPSIQSVSSSATVTPTFSNDMVKITAQAAGLTLANPTGTAIPGLGIVIRIKDNGTARTIAYGTQYRAIGVTLPVTTVISKTLYLAMIYNSDDTKWDVLAVGQEV